MFYATIIQIREEKNELWTRIQLNYTIWRLFIPTFNNVSNKEIEGDQKMGY